MVTGKAKTEISSLLAFYFKMTIALLEEMGRYENIRANFHSLELIVCNV